MAKRKRDIRQSAIGHHDRWRTLLRESLDVLSSDSTATIITWLEKELHDPETPVSDRLVANAALVGIVGVMLEEMEQAAKEADRG